jgi:hypothetical protein
MSDRIFWLLALIMALLCACLSVGYAATYAEYAAYRDGDPTAGTVARAERHRTYVTVEIEYKRGGKVQRTTAYPKIAEAAAFPVGARVDLLVGSRGAIRASVVEDKRPPDVLLAGAIGMLLLTVLCVALQLALRVPVARPEVPLDVIVVSLARTRNVRLGALILFVVIGAAFALVPLADDEAGVGVILGIEALALMTLGAAGYFGWVAFRLRDPRDNWILDLITRRPHDIAWFYEHVTHGRYGVTVQTAMIKDAYGKTADLRLTRADVASVFAELARRAPHAARGFSPELERQYRENPARWRPVARG